MPLVERQEVIKACKTSALLIPKVCLCEQVADENQGGLANPGLPVERLLERRYVGIHSCMDCW